MSYHVPSYRICQTLRHDGVVSPVQSQTLDRWYKSHPSLRLLVQYLGIILVQSECSWADGLLSLCYNNRWPADLSRPPPIWYARKAQCKDTCIDSISEYFKKRKSFYPSSAMKILVYHELMPDPEILFSVNTPISLWTKGYVGLFLNLPVLILCSK